MADKGILQWSEEMLLVSGHGVFWQIFNHCDPKMPQFLSQIHQFHYKGQWWPSSGKNPCHVWKTIPMCHRCQDAKAHAKSWPGHSMWSCPLSCTEQASSKGWWGETPLQTKSSGAKWCSTRATRVTKATMGRSNKDGSMSPWWCNTIPTICWTRPN